MKQITYRKFIITLLILQVVFTPGILIKKVFATDTSTKNSLTNLIQQQASQNTIAIQPQVSSLNISNTGDIVKASLNNTSNSQTTVQNNNSATVNQTVDASANTGYNEASRNISIGGNAGIINTGNAGVNVVGVVNANNSATGISGADKTSTTDSYVTNTGNRLSTATSSDSKQTTSILNNNKTIINQTANTSANTGGNVADRNISVGGQAGVITTGNASTNTNFLVTGNGAVTLVGGDSNGNGPGSGASIVLSNTGDKSRFGSYLAENNLFTVNNYNNSYVNQSCGTSNDSGLLLGLSGCSANTGNNSSNRGIARGGDAGAIQTGDAQVNVLMYAKANENNTAMNAGTGMPAAQSRVVNTGNNVDTNTSSTFQNANNINNSNNAQVDQYVNANANTGWNTANRNISIGGNAGTIKTGNAGVNVFMIADMNYALSSINHLMNYLVY